MGYGMPVVTQNNGGGGMGGGMFQNAEYFATPGNLMTWTKPSGFTGLVHVLAVGGGGIGGVGLAAGGFGGGGGSGLMNYGVFKMDTENVLTITVGGSTASIVYFGTNTGVGAKKVYGAPGSPGSGGGTGGGGTGGNGGDSASGADVAFGQFQIGMFYIPFWGKDGNVVSRTNIRPMGGSGFYFPQLGVETKFGAGGQGITMGENVGSSSALKNPQSGIVILMY